MPLLVLALVVLVLLLPLLFVALLPFTIVQRYRAGTARRLGRPWIARLNVVTIAFSAMLFLAVAGIMTVWVPQAFPYALCGLAGGGVLGLVGLKLTRWEPTMRGLHYTPNRLLVLLITVAVAARLLYGIVRAWRAWDYSDSTGSWLATSGMAGSLAVGAVVLGYYFIYWTGVARLVRRHSRARV